MSEITTVGLVLVKNVFQVYGADGAGRAVLRKKLRRAQVPEFFRQLPSVSSRWKRAEVPITGVSRSESRDMRCG